MTKSAILIEDGMFTGEAIQSNGDRAGLVPSHMRWSRVETVSYGRDRIAWMTDGGVKMAKHVFRMSMRGIILLLEPPQLHPETYEEVRRLVRDRHVHRVFTHHPSHVAIAASDIESTVLSYPFGGTRIHSSDWRMWPKDVDLPPVIIASDKASLPGHKLRHEVIEAVHNHPEHNVHAYGPSYTPLNRKIDALQLYRYAIAIENVNTGYWFTEALLDCFLTGTFPIYYGSRDAIHKWGFDENGVLFVDSVEEVLDAYELLKEHPNLHNYDFVQKAMRHNFIKAHEYTCVEDWLVGNYPQFFEEFFS